MTKHGGKCRGDETTISRITLNNETSSVIDRCNSKETSFRLALNVLEDARHMANRVTLEFGTRSARDIYKRENLRFKRLKFSQVRLIRPVLSTPSAN